MTTSNLYFTVFTPTFNRAHTLGRVYDSLCRQTFKDFEWVIVDDGSKDGTKDLVKSWIEADEINIRYFYQANQGKHVAHNLGVDNAKGELFLVVDSDDSCIETALEIFKTYWEDIPLAERKKFSTLTSLCIDIEGKVVGGSFPSMINDVCSYDEQLKHRSAGERFGVNRSDLMKTYKFPIFENEKFMPESVVWNRLSSKYCTRFVNKPLRVFEPLNDGLTSKMVQIRMKNPKGASLNYKENLIYTNSVFMKLKSAINYSRFSFHANEIPHFSSRFLNNFFVIAGLLPGYIYYLYDKAKNVNS